MAHDDGGFRADGMMMQYKGEEVWDHEVGPQEINNGEVDPDQDGDSDE
ncbi:hypothetical protein [Salarchaeum sp. JOR-1]|nr:hypothetical protein [Salarchaeum sp. JOR-1]